MVVGIVRIAETNHHAESRHLVVDDKNVKAFHVKDNHRCYKHRVRIKFFPSAC